MLETYHEYQHYRPHFKDSLLNMTFVFKAMFKKQLISRNNVIQISIFRPTWSPSSLVLHSPPNSIKLSAQNWLKTILF